jgi:hypothetical protein
MSAAALLAALTLALDRPRRNISQSTRSPGHRVQMHLRAR